MTRRSNAFLPQALPFGLSLFASLALGTSALLAQTAGQAADTAEAVGGAQWSDNVEITFDDAESTFRYRSDGIPSTYLAEFYLVPDDPGMMPFSTNPDATFWTLDAADIEASPIDTTITTQPVYSETVTETALGQIGVAINGARLFNDYEDMKRTIVALDDNVIHDHAAFVDECNGHPLGDGTSYHYHGLPTCLTEEVDLPGQHSVMIGVLQDGFPVYSNKDAEGEVVTNAALDECGGHYGATPEFADGIYHYHLTADEAPYSIDCYHGEIEMAARGGPGGQRELGSAADALGVSEQALRDALGDGPPDFNAAAEALGVSVEDLRAVMPLPPGQ
ncbi:YHYH protein [Limimaricola cinnabarinus]|uniref:YHYH protein n=1 Tax=Limimaricola cinnabarinus TaxID=1125964 RepID=UPI00249327F8|nr:YHYH protein [Limimaricola cinnabarinus]